MKALGNHEPGQSLPALYGVCEDIISSDEKVTCDMDLRGLGGMGDQAENAEKAFHIETMQERRPRGWLSAHR